MNEDQSSRIAVVITRSQAALFSQNRFDRSRRWSQQDLETIISIVEESTPRFDDIVIFSDSNIDLMMCIACQVRLFSMAKLVIGVTH